MPEIQDVIAWEAGEMDDEQEIAFFQKLLDTGAIHHLQGCYQRRMQELINEGLVS